MLLRFLSVLFIPLLAACTQGALPYSGPLNQWQISCGVDDGSIERNGNERVFRTSENYCTGGIFKQRAEIFTENYSTTRDGRFLFSTNMRMMSDVNREFSIFSIHDGRDGCAPPLQLFVRENGRMYISSDIKTGPGESCIRGTLGSDSPDRVLRDGTEQLVEVLLDFDGAGGFDVTVFLDGEPQITGSYRPSSNPAAILSERFYFKHGVYSRTIFDYEMRSRDMRVVALPSQ